MAGPRFRQLDRGSKKRVARIHWNRRDVLHAVFWSLILIACTIWLARWVSTHDF